MQTEVQSQGIKESLEILEGLIVVAPAGVEIAADKELSAKDIQPAVNAIKKYEIVVAAVENAKGAITEAKDYDMTELAVLGSKTLELINAIKEAYARGKAV